jgi:hypothetical protein
MSEKKEFMGLTLLIGAVIGIGAAGRSNNPQTLGVVAVILAVVVAAEYLFFYD